MSQRVSRYEDQGREPRRPGPFQPLLMPGVLVLGILIGYNLMDGPVFVQSDEPSGNPGKLVRVLNQIEKHYVDTVEQQALIDEAIGAVLEKLDPHSYYISPEDYLAVQERMQGNFEGIGIEFIIRDDTLVVVEPLEGGPSLRAGIQSGDKIITVDGDAISGTGINSERVTEELKGPSNSPVSLGIQRKGESELLEFSLKRGRIPIHSVVASLMVAPKVGYIKVTQFAANTHAEFVKGLEELADEGATSIIIDFRGNPGGYLDQARHTVEEFLEKDRLIVFTQGRKEPEDKSYSRRNGKYQDMNVVILQNQSSASASEVVAGALQDWDRALTVGRRSFGKGLVQHEYGLGDNSAIRLTVARYYTPTGRCIQKPYGDEIEYGEDYHDRFESGELLNADSIAQPDSLKYYTPAGRLVYGGGGITPDVFVPLDTVGGSAYLSELSYSGLIREFGFDYYDRHRDELERFKSHQDFDEKWSPSEAFISEFVAYAAAHDVEEDAIGLEDSREVIENRLTAYVAKNIFGQEYFYYFDLQDDNDFLKSLEVARAYDDYFAQSVNKSKALAEAK